MSFRNVRSVVFVVLRLGFVDVIFVLVMGYFRLIRGKGLGLLKMGCLILLLFIEIRLKFTIKIKLKRIKMRILCMTKKLSIKIILFILS